MDQIKILEISTEESHLVNELVSAEFGYPFGHSYFDDFPVWGTSQSLRLGGYSGTELVSHVGIHFRKMKTQKGSEPVALIGAVATKKAHRGLGHSSKLILEAVRRIDEAGCAWSFLWGSEHDFYSKFGYSLSGTQARAPIQSLLESRKGPAAIFPIKGFTSRIHDEFISRKSGLQFSSSDLEWLSKQTTVEWLRIDQPFGYIAYGRGLDLKGIIHEFGGDPESIRNLFLHILRTHPGAEVLGRPSDLVLLGFPESTLIKEGLCLARPLYPTTSWNPEFWISGLSAV